MSEETFDPSSSPDTGVPSEAIYSWIGSYITAKNSVQPVSPNDTDDSQNPMNTKETTPVPNPADDGDFSPEDDKSDAEPLEETPSESRQKTPDDSDPGED